MVLDFEMQWSLKVSVAKFWCTALLGAAWVAGRRRPVRDFAGKILE